MPEIEALQNMTADWTDFSQKKYDPFKHRHICREGLWCMLGHLESLTTIEGRSAVDVSGHEGWLCLLSHRVVPHTSNSALKPVNEVMELLNGREQQSINSNAVSVHVCHLSVYGCMTCLAAGVVAVVGTQGRILQRPVRARSRGATAAVRMTQALAVLLMNLKHRALALTHTAHVDWCSNASQL